MRRIQHANLLLLNRPSWACQATYIVPTLTQTSHAHCTPNEWQARYYVDVGRCRFAFNSMHEKKENKTKTLYVWVCSIGLTLDRRGRWRAHKTRIPYVCSFEWNKSIDILIKFHLCICYGSSAEETKKRSSSICTIQKLHIFVLQRRKVNMRGPTTPRNHRKALDRVFCWPSKRWMAGQMDVIHIEMKSITHVFSSVWLVDRGMRYSVELNSHAKFYLLDGKKRWRCPFMVDFYF